MSFGSNPLRTRQDLQDAVRSLWAPLPRHLSPAGARLCLGFPAAHFGADAAEFEAYARPLWGLAPLAAGGGELADWDRLRQGLVHGTSIDHPEYWGTAEPWAHQLVDMPAVAFALAVAREQMWEPLSPAERDRVVRWLQGINAAPVWNNNWCFFPVLVNLFLARLGVPPDRAVIGRYLERLEAHYLGDGWYADGRTAQRDHYVAFAYHFYGLLAASSPDIEDAVRERFLEHSATFATRFVRWFAPDGACVPFGRSLTYKFAQVAFWGALAYAGLQALPWPQIKGIFLRNLRWWSRRPILDRDGVLSVGYAYPNPEVRERYIAAGSSYWAFKAFLPLALPDSHPFWQAEEAPLPALGSVEPQAAAGMVLCEDEIHRHRFALSSGQWSPRLRNGESKYGKFAYSAAFGFDLIGARGGEQDGMLVVATPAPGEPDYRGRSACLTAELLDQDVLRSVWQPRPDVEITTWLIPLPPFHIRIHRVRSACDLLSCEGGFSIPYRLRPTPAPPAPPTPDSALVVGDGAWSGIRDLLGGRDGRVVLSEPNANAISPYSAFPVLQRRLVAGEAWLACAVCALPGEEPGVQWARSPALPAGPWAPGSPAIALEPAAATEVLVRFDDAERRLSLDGPGSPMPWPSA